MEQKELIKKFEKQYELKKHGVKIKYNKETNEYEVKVKCSSDRRDLENLIFRVLMNSKS